MWLLFLGYYFSSVSAIWDVFKNVYEPLNIWALKFSMVYTKQCVVIYLGILLKGTF